MTDIDPDGIYHLDITGKVDAGATDTGEVERIDNPTEHTQRTKITGRQVIALRQQLADGKPAQLHYQMHDEGFLIGDAGEFIETDSAIPPDLAA